MNNIQYYTRLNQFGRLADYASFNEVEFFKQRKYYVNKKYGRLHIYVYQEENQLSLNKIIMDKNDRDIVHHKDENPSNNHISNLQCLTLSEHTALHAKNRTDETKQKLSDAGKGKKHMLGKKHTDEAKKKISDARKGKKHSQDAKQKISDANKGKQRTDETKQKISEAAKRILTNEMIQDSVILTCDKFTKKYKTGSSVWYRCKEEYNNKIVI